MTKELEPPAQPVRPYPWRGLVGLVVLIAAAIVPALIAQGSDSANRAIRASMLVALAGVGLGGATGGVILAWHDPSRRLAGACAAVGTIGANLALYGWMAWRSSSPSTPEVLLAMILGGSPGGMLFGALMRRRANRDRIPVARVR